MKITITIPEAVRQVLGESAERSGLSMSAYISHLIMKADHEYQAVRLLKTLDDAQLRRAVQESMEAKEDK